MTIEIQHDPALKLGQTVRFDTATLTADGALADGGDAKGPNPHDLYDAALGACKAMTVLWYARRKALPVEDVRVSVDRDASGERSGRYVLSARMTVRGRLSQEQLQELLAVAEKCPVHKLMTSVSTEIHTTLALES